MNVIIFTILASIILASISLASVMIREALKEAIGIYKAISIWAFILTLTVEGILLFGVIHTFLLNL
jgi:hypothetical protein